MMLKEFSKNCVKREKEERRKGAVALANIFAGRQPYFSAQNGIEISYGSDAIYKRSSFIDIPFGMPFISNCFYF